MVMGSDWSKEGVALQLPLSVQHGNATLAR